MKMKEDPRYDKGISTWTLVGIWVFIAAAAGFILTWRF
jgi:hypothetical protein